MAMQTSAPADEITASQLSFAQRSKTKSESGPSVKKYKCVIKYAFAIIGGTTWTDTSRFCPDFFFNSHILREQHALGYVMLSN